ncbi:hypothetical protein AVEN_154602-1, partial [Araneus ventricosus]
SESLYFGANLVILKCSQMTRTTPELDPPFQISTPHQLEEDGPSTCDLKCHRPTYTVALM